MIDVNTHKPSRTQPEYYADHDVRHRPSEITIELSDTYPMATFGRKSNFATVVKFFNMIGLYT